MARAGIAGTSREGPKRPCRTSGHERFQGIAFPGPFAARKSGEGWRKADRIQFCRTFFNSGKQ